MPEFSKPGASQVVSNLSDILASMSLISLTTFQILGSRFVERWDRQGWSWSLSKSHICIWPASCNVLSLMLMLTIHIEVEKKLLQKCDQNMEEGWLNLDDNSKNVRIWKAKQCRKKIGSKKVWNLYILGVKLLVNRGGALVESVIGSWIKAKDKLRKAFGNESEIVNEK